MQKIVNKNLKRLLSNHLNSSNSFKYLRTTSIKNNDVIKNEESNNKLNNEIDNQSTNQENQENNQSTILDNHNEEKGYKGEIRYVNETTTISSVSNSKDKNYLEFRDKAVIELKKTYIKKLESFTPWRKQYEDKLSKRRIPLPFSLTGFGDSSKNTKFWVQRIRTTLDELINLKVKKTYFDSLPASVQYFLENKPDALDSKYQLIINRFNDEKTKLINNLNELTDGSQISKAISLPFNFKENLQKIFIDDKNLIKEDSKKTKLVDRDYENYKKHHHLLEYFANKFGGRATNYEVGEELIALSNTMWHRDYGSENSKIKPSNTPCSGCGSNLHCTSSNIPGYIPYEKFSELSQRELKRQLCQRCDFLKNYNISLNVNVNPKEYEEIISKLVDKDGLILLMVDITDFPCSVNSKILDLIGKNRKTLIVVNKIDLLPKDGNNYLNRIRETVNQNLNLNKNFKSRDIFLISAKTGFGLDNLISTIYKLNDGKKDVYLLGCTNVGKSTLFNNLLQSDLCRLREYDLIQRATTSVWPGTTLNLLKFPIRALPAWEKELRKRRLFLRQIKTSIDEKELRYSMKYQSEDKNLFLKMENRISSTFQKELPFKFESNHPFSKLNKKPEPFSDEHPAFKNSNYFYDTPGTIFNDQILSLLTTEELLKTIPRKTIRPRTFTLEPFQTLFIGGLGRLDLLHSKDSILVTVFASDYLPVHIVNLEEALRFYELYLQTDYLGVPINDGNRLETWPSLISKDFHIKNERTSINNIGNQNTSLCDILFSSAGWIALTLNNGSECIVKAYTPEGRGIYLRKPSLLPRCVMFRGPKIHGTPCFEYHTSFLKELEDDENKKLIKKSDNDINLPVLLSKKLLYDRN